MTHENIVLINFINYKYDMKIYFKFTDMIDIAYFHERYMCYAGYEFSIGGLEFAIFLQGFIRTQNN